MEIKKQLRGLALLAAIATPVLHSNVGEQIKDMKLNGNQFHSEKKFLQTMLKSEDFLNNNLHLAHADFTKSYSECR